MPNRHPELGNLKIETVPFKGLKSLAEHNAGERVLSHEEFGRLVANCLPHTARIVAMAYYTAMRRGEILCLRRDRIDMKSGFIRLLSEDTPKRMRAELYP